MLDQNCGVMFVSDLEQNHNDTIDASIPKPSTIVMEDDDDSIDFDDI